MQILKRAALHFALVFGTGFMFGKLRVLWLVPRVGVRMAELAESPLMLAATVLAGRWVTRRFPVGARLSASLGIGLTALTLLLAAEIGLGFALRGGSVQEIPVEKKKGTGHPFGANLLFLWGMIPDLHGCPRRVRSRAKRKLRSVVTRAGSQGRQLVVAAL